MKKTILMNEFSAKVIRLVKSIPRGKVATYGQIAALAGKPHGARGVGWILNSCAESHKMPWQRVLNSQGRISFPKDTLTHNRQRRLLEREGVRFSESGHIDMFRFQWTKKARAPRKSATKSSGKWKKLPTMFG